MLQSIIKIGVGLIDHENMRLEGRVSNCLLASLHCRQNYNALNTCAFTQFWPFRRQPTDTAQTQLPVSIILSTNVHPGQFTDTTCDKINPCISPATRPVGSKFPLFRGTLQPWGPDTNRTPCDCTICYTQYKELSVSK